MLEHAYEREATLQQHMREAYERERE